MIAFIQGWTHYQCKQLHRKKKKTQPLLASQQHRAVRSTTNAAAEQMPTLSEMFSVESSALARASGNDVAPGYVLSTLLSTTTATNDKGDLMWHDTYKDFLQVQNFNWIDFSLDEGGMIHVTGVEAVFERNITVAEQVH